MAQRSLITDEMRKLIGMTTEPVVFKVEEGAIQRYAEAIGDPNPLYNDVEYARESKYGRLICPPGFTGWPTKLGVWDPLALPVMLIKAGAPPSVLDGGIEYEFFETIGAGDVLASTSKIVSMSEKETKSGKMVVTIVETTFLNQNGDVVVKSWATVINR